MAAFAGMTESSAQSNIVHDGISGLFARDPTATNITLAAARRRICSPIRSAMKQTHRHFAPIADVQTGKEIRPSTARLSGLNFVHAQENQR